MNIAFSQLEKLIKKPVPDDMESKFLLTQVRLTAPSEKSDISNCVERLLFIVLLDFSSKFNTLLANSKTSFLKALLFKLNQFAVLIIHIFTAHSRISICHCEVFKG